MPSCESSTCCFNSLSILSGLAVQNDSAKFQKLLSQLGSDIQSLEVKSSQLKIQHEPTSSLSHNFDSYYEDPRRPSEYPRSVHKGVLSGGFRRRLPEALARFPGFSPGLKWTHCTLHDCLCSTLTCGQWNHLLGGLSLKVCFLPSRCLVN